MFVRQSGKHEIYVLKFYNDPQPPESMLLSSFLATMLGIPCDSQVLRITSHLAWCKYCRRPRRLIF